MSSKRVTIKTDIDVDFKFWVLLPALNINLRSKGVEFEWLCVGIYVSKMKQETPKNILEYGLHISLNSKPAMKTIKKLQRKLLWLKVKMYFKRLFGYECD